MSKKKAMTAQQAQPVTKVPKSRKRKVLPVPAAPGETVAKVPDLEVAPVPNDVPLPRAAEATTSASEVPAEEPTKGRKPRQPKAAPAKAERKGGALDAAARVLTEAGTPLTCKGMIDAMASKGYWASPKGKTPEATLYAALLKEITAKRGSTRFQRTGRGLFALSEDRT